MESSMQNLPEKSFISRTVLDAVERVFEGLGAQTETDALFRELELGYDAENPMYISEDASRLPVIIHQLEKDGKIYFLGYAKE
jgi:hypothetical protein